jgi:Family of unknown function (DUF5988)
MSATAMEVLVMTDIQSLVTADLQGGPPAFPEELRHPQVSPTDDKVKVRYNTGYEHFERDPGAETAVYRWSGHTRIAE